MTDRSASFAGPLLVGAITQITGEFTYAFLLIVVMVLLPIPLLFWVDVDLAEEQASAWSLKQQGLEGRDGVVRRELSVGRESLAEQSISGAPVLG